VTSLPVATVSGRVVIGYADLPRLSNLAGLTFGHSGDRLDLSGQLTVPVLGSVSFSGSGTVTVVAGRLAVHVQTLDVGGVSASGPELSTISAAVGDAISIPTLPYGLKIDSVQVAPTGLVITGGAKGVTLTSS
jgi:hypothetical protein